MEWNSLYNFGNRRFEDLNIFLRSYFKTKDNPLLANLGKDFLYASVHHQCHQYILTDKRNTIGKIQSHVTSMLIHN